MATDADRNLLFAVLALQAGLLDSEQFVQGCTLWSAGKGASLPDVFCAQGWLTEQDRTHVDYLVERRLSRHGGDPQASLAAVATERALRGLARVTDPVVQESLAGLSAADDPAAGQLTTAYEPQGRGRYTIARLHAKGGMGQVWVARDEDLGRDVALKELRPERAALPISRDRFLHEARITGRLEHPAIAPIYELAPGDDRQPPFYTMRFVRGRTLAEAIRDGRAPDGAAGVRLRELLTAFVAVCNAVAYAHARGVLHRDLKPHNVVLGEFGEVVVLDWGLAKVVGSKELPAGDGPLASDGSADRTVQGQVLGTPSYLPPEQAEGRLEELDARSDVYGLGAVLYEVLTGVPPFTGDVTDILRRVVHEPPVPPRQIAPATPRPLEAVCLKALAKRPADRYGSARELAEEVGRWLADEPVRAWPEPRAVRARRWLGRHRTLAAVAAASLLVAAVGLGLTAVLLDAANARERQARKGEREARLTAEEDFRIAREAVDGFLTRVSDSPQLRSTGLEKLRRELLGQAKDFYERFARGHGDDPDLQAERGRAYVRLASLTADLGGLDEAARAAEQGRDVFERLASEHSDAAAYRDGLARALQELGRINIRANRPEAARAAVERSLALREQLVAEHPDDAGYRFALAAALSQAGLLYGPTLNRPADAEAALTRALGLLAALVRERPDVREYRREQAESLARLGYLRGVAGKPDEAVAAYAEQLPVWDELIRERPDDPEAQHRRGSMLNDLGTAHLNAKRPGPARAAFEQARAAGERLVRAHPDVPEYRVVAGDSRAGLAMCLALLGEHARAAAEAESAVTVAPESPFVQYNAAAALAQCAAAARRDTAGSAADRERAANQYAARAVRLLQQARRAGFFKSRGRVQEFEQDTDLDPLRQRDDFKELMRELKQGAG